MCFVASIVFPLWIASLRLSLRFLGYSINLEERHEYEQEMNCLKKFLFIICDQMLAIFAPILLECRMMVLEREYNDLVHLDYDKLKVENKNKVFLNTIEKRKKVHYQKIIFKKLEMSLETILQLCGQILLFFLAESETRTLQAFITIFKPKEVGITDLTRKIETEENNIKLEAPVIIALSIFVSIFAFTYSQAEGVAGNRIYFPIKSKIIIGFSALIACITRVGSVLLYFAPVFGLWNMARHLQGTKLLF